MARAIDNSNINIAYNAEDFNPDVKKHEGIRVVEIILIITLKIYKKKTKFYT